MMKLSASAKAASGPGLRAHIAELDLCALCAMAGMGGPDVGARRPVAAVVFRRLRLVIMSGSSQTSFLPKGVQN
jgi:hypothetical protein